jgi:hypothetical protein
MTTKGLTGNKEEIFIKVLNNIKQFKNVSPEETTFIFNSIRQLNLEKFSGYKNIELCNIITGIIIKQLEPKADLREYLKTEIEDTHESENALTKIKIDKKETVNTLLQKPHILQHIFNPDARLKTGYLHLDSKYRSRETDKRNIFTWNINVSGTDYDSKSSAISTSDIKNITSIRMFPFRFPNTPNAITSARRLSVEMVELNNQAYITYGNNRYHFMFRINESSALVSGAFTPSAYLQYEADDIDQSEAKFTFSNPIVELTKLSLRFRNPFTELELDPDVLPAVISAVGVNTLLTFSIPHRITIGDEVIINGFNTTTPDADYVEIDQMNNSNGWAVASNTAFTVTIPVDISGLSGAIIGNPFNIYLNSKRFIIRLEIKYIS